VRPNGVEDAPQFKLDIDREKASALGISITDINQTLQTGWASTYVNDFIDRGRVKRVYVQGDPGTRMQPDDLNRWYVRNNKGEMVPFSAFGRGEWTYGPQKLVRFNGVPAFQIQGAPSAGHSSGDAMKAMEALVAKLPQGVGMEWTGLSFEEKVSGSQAPLLYILSLAIVFLCLSALYESWSIPVTVLLVVPLGVLGAVLATLLRGLSNDAYFQVGLLVTIGISAKNAILIVEFARQAEEQLGMNPADAAAHAARTRLRPIIMTSVAFIAGVAPLAFGSGAGSEMRHALGIAVFFGMIGVTVFGLLFTPVFYVACRWLSERFRRRPKAVAPPAGEPVKTGAH